MRISKSPEERKQEMIDTAMKLFSTKGYEATTMTDIAKEMKVVSGLCYRYFRSKEELYYCAVEQYASECALPVIKVINEDFDSMEEYVTRLSEQFSHSDGHEKYHDFFHEEGNKMFHKQLEQLMLEQLKSPMIAMLERMNKRGLIKVEECKYTALFLLYGQMPIINDDILTTEEKIRLVRQLINKVMEIN